MPSSRRDFLIKASTFTLATTGSIAVLGGVAVAAPDAGTVMWKLDAAWGFPVGPKGATRCGCNACVRHAANKVFLSRDAALAGRCHAGCRCQPAFFTVPPVVYFEMVDRNTAGVSLDRRTPAVGDAMSAFGIGGSSSPTTVVPTTAGPSTTTQPSSASGAPTPPTPIAPDVVAAAEAPHGPRRAAPPLVQGEHLAFTGSTTWQVLAGGVLAVAAGTSAMALALRRNEVAACVNDPRLD